MAAIDTVPTRADAATVIIVDLRRNGIPMEIAHDLLSGYAEALQGYAREERGARKVMISAGVLPGSLEGFRKAEASETRAGP